VITRWQFLKVILLIRRLVLLQLCRWLKHLDGSLLVFRANKETNTPSAKHEMGCNISSEWLIHVGFDTAAFKHWNREFSLPNIDKPRDFDWFIDIAATLRRLRKNVDQFDVAITAPGKPGPVFRLAFRTKHLYLLGLTILRLMTRDLKFPILARQDAGCKPAGTRY
jgi:hypothetical protein